MCRVALVWNRGSAWRPPAKAPQLTGHNEHSTSPSGVTWGFSSSDLQAPPQRQGRAGGAWPAQSRQRGRHSARGGAATERSASHVDAQSGDADRSVCSPSSSSSSPTRASTSRAALGPSRERSRACGSTRSTPSGRWRRSSSEGTARRPCCPASACQPSTSQAGPQHVACLCAGKARSSPASATSLRSVCPEALQPNALITARWAARLAGPAARSCTTTGPSSTMLGLALSSSFRRATAAPGSSVATVRPQPASSASKWQMTQSQAVSHWSYEAETKAPPLPCLRLKVPPAFLTSGAKPACLRRTLRACVAPSSNWTGGVAPKCTSSAEPARWVTARAVAARCQPLSSTYQRLRHPVTLSCT